MASPKHSIMMRIRALSIGFLILAACGTPPRGGGEVGPAGNQPAADPGSALGSSRPSDASAPREPVIKRWTSQFQHKSIVVAEEIRIEGPAGLIDHLAVRSDDALFDRKVETTEDGLRMEWRSKVSGELIRGQLDNWSLTAFRVVTAVERPWAEEVTVTALGEAFWQDVDGQEQRADRLQWRGELE